MKKTILILMTLMLTSCELISLFMTETSVTLTMVDESGLAAGEKCMLSIYDPEDDSDFRYSQYSTNRTVTFTDVEPGTFRAHCNAWTDGKNAVIIEINEGDVYDIVFTYGKTGSISLPIFGGYGNTTNYDQDVYEWSYTLDKK